MAGIPIWLLDVDGVINAFGRGDDVATAWPKYETVVVEGWNIRYAPEVVQFIRNVHENKQAEVRWLTTWEDSANTSLAPALGLPEFEVAGRHDGSEWFKYPAAKRAAAEGRPLIWTDDDLLWQEDAWEWLKTKQHEVAAIAPNGRQGLEPEHLNMISKFIEGCNMQDF